MSDTEEFEDSPPPPPPPPPPGLEHYIRHNPTAAVVGALVIGIILGRIGIL